MIFFIIIYIKILLLYHFSNRIIYNNNNINIFEVLIKYFKWYFVSEAFSVYDLGSGFFVLGL